MITDGLMKPMKEKEISADKGNGLFIKEAQKYLEENLGKSTMEKKILEQPCCQQQDSVVDSTMLEAYFLQ